MKKKLKNAKNRMKCFLVNFEHISFKALNRGTSIYLANLPGMFDVLTQQEIAKVKPYIY